MLLAQARFRGGGLFRRGPCRQEPIELRIERRIDPITHPRHIIGSFCDGLLCDHVTCNPNNCHTEVSDQESDRRGDRIWVEKGVPVVCT